MMPMLRAWCGDERSLALVADDPTMLDPALDKVETAGIDLWQTERSLSLLAAYGRVPVGAARLDALVAWAEPRGLRPLLAPALRLRARHRPSRRLWARRSGRVGLSQFHRPFVPCSGPGYRLAAAAACRPVSRER